MTRKERIAHWRGLVEQQSESGPKVAVSAVSIRPVSTSSTAGAVDFETSNPRVDQSAFLSLFAARSRCNNRAAVFEFALAIA